MEGASPHKWSISDEASYKQGQSLSLISPRASFNTRLMVANGIVISTICYHIQIWGGSEDYLIQPLQVLMNKAARIVTGCKNLTSTKILLIKCNWLSNKQLIFFQTVTMMLTKSSFYMNKKFIMNYPYDTRQATGGCIRYGEDFHSRRSLFYDSFRYRTAKDYNSIPVQIRNCRSMATFKSKLGKWVVSNIPVDWADTCTYLLIHSISIQLVYLYSLQLRQKFSCKLYAWRK